MTPIDIALTALARVAAAADSAGVGHLVQNECHDMSRSLPDDAFDLVYACYAHSHIDIGRDRALARASALLASGGLLVVVDHASLAPWSDTDHAPTSFPTAGETWGSIGLGEGWRVERLETIGRTANHPDGRSATVTDNLIVGRRCAPVT